MSHLPPEARLLFLATRPSGPDADAALSEAVKLPLNWYALGALAEREQLLPVLWKRLRYHADVIPLDVAGALQRAAAVTEFHMGLTETMLAEALDLLIREKIGVMLLKGAALAKSVYPSFASRPMGDIDLLVAPDQAQRAWQCLRDSGWKEKYEGLEEFYRTIHHLPGLFDPKGLKVLVEIHRSMLPPSGPFDLDETELWRDAHPVSVGPNTAWVPSDQHQLLHLCIHFAWSHGMGWAVGRTVRDIATLLQVRAIDWPSFVALAAGTRATTAAYWTLSIARTLAGATVPAGALESMRPRQWRPASRILERSYIMTSLLDACPSVRARQFLWTAGMRPGASGHGASRPWDVAEAFMQATHVAPNSSVFARATGQLRSLRAWLRFARVLGSREQVM